VATILLSGTLSMVIAVLGTRPAITALRKRKLGQQIRSDGPPAHLSKSGTLRSGAKLAGQAAAGAIFAILAVRFPDSFNLTPASPHLSFLTDFGVSIGPVLFVVWAVVMVTGTSNAVNLTDGLDGLAAGAAIIVLAAYVIIGYLQSRNDCVKALFFGCSAVRDPLDAAVIQVGSYKLTRKRVFRMAPLQHHFELAGWAETTIVVRFWMIAGVFVVLGLWIFYRGGPANLLGGVAHVR
jgi:UDP-N-acetylmuramyl pentapeptide phosphotransferase/UDP-N-acetylglucosamine-1-phosphate transferase